MIRLLLVDDHEVVRAGYRRLLEGQGDLQVLAEADDGNAAYRLAQAQSFDVSVIDLGLPGMGGLELIGRLARAGRGGRLLACSMHRDALWATQALRAGALGYVTKSSPAEQLVTAVRALAQGRRHLSPDVATEVTATLLADETPAAYELSPRELEVLRGLIAGRSAQEVAEALSLSVKTVHNLHYQAKAKLGTRTDFDLARMAWERGWMDG